MAGCHNWVRTSDHVWAPRINLSDFACQSMKYRQNAAECYEAARILSDHREKAKMLAIAQSWITLGALAERNSQLEAAITGLTGHGNGVVHF